MIFRPADESAARAVRALAREAAEADLPPIDWDRIESRLFADVVDASASTEVARPAPRVAEPSARPKRAASPWPVALAAAAAVALISGARWGDGQPKRDEHALRGGALVHGITLGDSLEVGDSVESRAQPLVYEKKGLVTFTVAPSSRVALVAAERDGETPGALTIALTRGSVHAEVRPRLVGEAFAVEVEHTRVAVHGTSFTVSREGDRVVVEVAHGSVAVGPTGHAGSTQGWLLVGPDRGRFSVDGARDAEWVAMPSGSERVETTAHLDHLSISPEPSVAGPGKVSAVAAAPLQHAGPRSDVPHGAGGSSHFEKSLAARAGAEQEPARAVEPDAPSRSIEAEAPQRTAAEQEQAATAGILRELDLCYEKQVGSFGVVFSIRSSLTLSVLPNGAIREGVFNPPLSPTLTDCVRNAITSARFPSSGSVHQIHLPVNLSR